MLRLEARSVTEDSVIKAWALAHLPRWESRRVAAHLPWTVFNAGSELPAIEGTCTHQDAPPLSDGRLEGCLIECPPHGSSFDLQSENPAIPLRNPVDPLPASTGISLTSSEGSARRTVVVARLPRLPPAAVGLLRMDVLPTLRHGDAFHPLLTNSAEHLAVIGAGLSAVKAAATCRTLDLKVMAIRAWHKAADGASRHLTCLVPSGAPHVAPTWWLPGSTCSSSPGGWPARALQLTQRFEQRKLQHRSVDGRWHRGVA
jgi:3-phenylpropionate/trans-cinnamate dioxygenase ferredoxin component